MLLPSSLSQNRNSPSVEPEKDITVIFSILQNHCYTKSFEVTKDDTERTQQTERVIRFNLLLFLCQMGNTQHIILDQHGMPKQHHMFPG